MFGVLSFMVFVSIGTRLNVPFRSSGSELDFLFFFLSFFFFLLDCSDFVVVESSSEDDVEGDLGRQMERRDAKKFIAAMNQKNKNGISPEEKDHWTQYFRNRAYSKFKHNCPKQMLDKIIHEKSWVIFEGRSSGDMKLSKFEPLY